MNTDPHSPHRAQCGVLVAVQRPSAQQPSSFVRQGAAPWQRSPGAGRFVGIAAAALAGVAIFGSQLGIAHHYGEQAEAAQLAQRSAQQRLASRQAVEPSTREVLRAPPEKPVTRRG